MATVRARTGKYRSAQAKGRENALELSDCDGAQDTIALISIFPGSVDSSEINGTLDLKALYRTATEGHEGASA